MRSLLSILILVLTSTSARSELVFTFTEAPDGGTIMNASGTSTAEFPAFGTLILDFVNWNIFNASQLGHGLQTFPADTLTGTISSGGGTSSPFEFTPRWSPSTSIILRTGLIGPGMLTANDFQATWAVGNLPFSNLLTGIHAGVDDGIKIVVVGPTPFDISVIPTPPPPFPTGIALDAALGITEEYTVEDFEDLNFEDGIVVLVRRQSSVTLWDTVVQGLPETAWTPTKTLYNLDAGIGLDGQDVEFQFPSPVDAFGVGISHAFEPLNIYVNDQAYGLLQDQPGWDPSIGVRNGYIWINKLSSEQITSVRFHSTFSGDAIFYDHAAWLDPNAPSVPSMSSWGLWTLCGLVILVGSAVGLRRIRVQ